MTADVSPLRLLLVTLAGWVNRHQQQVIEYLVEENRVLREQLKGRRVRLTDSIDVSWCASKPLALTRTGARIVPGGRPPPAVCAASSRALRCEPGSRTGGSLTHRAWPGCRGR